MTAAWVRSEIPSFVNIALMWFRTVPSDKNRRSEISELFKPFASKRNTSISRSVNLLVINVVDERIVGYL